MKPARPHSAVEEELLKIMSYLKIRIGQIASPNLSSGANIDSGRGDGDDDRALIHLSARREGIMIFCPHAT